MYQCLTFLLTFAVFVYFQITDLGKVNERLNLNNQASKSGTNPLPINERFQEFWHSFGNLVLVEEILFRYTNLTNI